MSEPKHTPGPWDMRDEPMRHRANVVVRALLPDGRTPKIATVIEPTQHATRERDANAKLIAAAPTLADALHSLYMDGVSFGSRYEQVIAALRAAGRLP